jgi:hypothetical protein
MQDDGSVRSSASEVVPPPVIGTREEGGDEEVALINRSYTSVGGTDANHHQTASASPSIPSTRAVIGLPFISKRLGLYGEDRAGNNNRVTERIEFLVKAYQESDMDLDTNQCDQAEGNITGANGDAGSEQRDVEVESAALRGYRRASWWTQFTILSGRAFKNLYRNPMLLLTHYAVSIVLARESSCLFPLRCGRLADASVLPD